MKKIILPCLYGLTAFLLVGITLSGCEKSSSDWKSEMLGSDVYAQYIRDGIAHSNYVAAHEYDRRHIEECLNSTGRKYDKAWVDCLSSSEVDQKYAKLLIQQANSVKALGAAFPQIGQLTQEERLTLLVKPTTGEMLSNSSPKKPKSTQQ
ncbi:MAG: hypothetical protein ABIV51_01920 [Saprospiraceae bacterium]